MILHSSLSHLRIALLAPCLFGMASCIGGSRFLLPGHAPAERADSLPPLVMQQGETRLIICEWGRPMKWGFSPGLDCADESVAQVEYEGGALLQALFSSAPSSRESPARAMLTDLPKAIRRSCGNRN